MDLCRGRGHYVVGLGSLTLCVFGWGLVSRRGRNRRLYRNRVQLFCGGVGGSAIEEVGLVSRLGDKMVD